MKLELWYPVKSLHINQQFGENAEYYARFKDYLGNPLKGHNGLDLMASHGQPVYAPCDGKAYYSVDSHGGDGIYIHTGNYLVILWHLCSKDDEKFKPTISCDGSLTDVKIGQLLGYADNTGAPFESSGDHLHLGLIPVNEIGQAVYANNGYAGCIDPMSYFNGYFAEDAEQVTSILQKLILLYKSVIDIFKK